MNVKGRGVAVAGFTKLLPGFYREAEKIKEDKKKLYFVVDNGDLFSYK